MRIVSAQAANALEAMKAEIIAELKAAGIIPGEKKETKQTTNKK